MKHPGRLAGELTAELAVLTAADRHRTCPPVEGASRTHLGGTRPLVSFASNDYLGFAAHPALAEAAAAAASAQGFGASASRLIADLPSTRQLEATLAAAFDYPAALVFPTGYQTNIGVLTALAGRDDLIVSDALNHASLIDGCRLSRARVEIFPHADANAAARLLATPGPFRRRVLVTESVFSMDGDAAPLAALAAAAAEAAAVLVVDEAHAVGVLGPDGRGLCAAAGIRPDALIGTLGKAFGAAGGFVLGEAVLRDLLVNRARTFIYTTGLPPPVAAAATAAVTLAAGPEGSARRATLDSHRRRLGETLAGLPDLPPAAVQQPQLECPVSASAIVPILLGTEARALAVSAALRAAGLYVPAIRPPTVPPGASRLRVSLSAGHSDADLARLVAGLAAATTSPGTPGR